MAAAAAACFGWPCAAFGAPGPHCLLLYPSFRRRSPPPRGGAAAQASAPAPTSTAAATRDSVVEFRRRLRVAEVKGGEDEGASWVGKQLAVCGWVRTYRAQRTITFAEMPEAGWNEENTGIICQLFAEQVRAGNRPNTHLNNNGYSEVASKFEQRKRVLYTKTQLNNKWDKLKVDYINWKKLLARGASLGWNNSKGTIAADNDWWKNTFKELPGAKKLRKAGIRNEDHLKVMFEDITSNNGVDHLPLEAGSLPSAPDSTMNVKNLDGSDNNVEDNEGTQVDYYDDTQLEHESPSTRNKKRSIHVDAKKDKTSKTETALLMQA